MAVLRYWAGARAAAGVAEEPVDAATLAEALDAARGRSRRALRPGAERLRVRRGRAAGRADAARPGDPGARRGGRGAAALRGRSARGKVALRG